MKKWLKNSHLVFVISAVFLSGCVSQTTTQPQIEKFKLTEDNFNLVSLTWKPYTVGISTTLDGICSQYKNYQIENPSVWDKNYQLQEFVISYNVQDYKSWLQSKNFKTEDQKMDCSVIVDGVKWYAKFGHIGWSEGASSDSDSVIYSSRFVDNLSGECANGCRYARADMMKSSEITFCCNGVCKTKTLPNYCK